MGAMDYHKYAGIIIGVIYASILGTFISLVDQSALIEQSEYIEYL